ncbi:MAG: helix-turn-helix domain-containing protein [Oscillospiraceae bacterium]|nr:helix-turn-helix domain-containing protein [Oscillospiraceae bacterium]
MEISIGKTIKRLRAEKGVTQEELAKYLNITFQSVSKWETDAATPDTMLLPKIAIFFGVAIDDLFAVGDVNHFETVDKILEEPGEELSDSSFLYAKRYLVGLLEENAENTEALRRMVDLYKKRIDGYTEIAGRYSEQLINTDLNNHQFHQTYARLRGVQWDYEPIGWRFFRFYDNFIKKYPDNKEAQVNLHNAYVQTDRYKEADEMSARIADEITRVILKGDTLIRLGREAEAFVIYDKLMNDYSNDPNVFLEVGERYRRLAERRFNPENYANYFEKAVQIFEQSQKLLDSTMNPPPCNPCFSLAFMYESWGEYEKAIEMWEEIIIRCHKDFYDVGLDWHTEMLESLKTKIAER